jgi:hypothetical protein
MFLVAIVTERVDTDTDEKMNRGRERERWKRRRPNEMYAKCERKCNNASVRHHNSAARIPPRLYTVVGMRATVDYHT